MKILHLCTGFKISYQGGITNYVRSLAESQVKAGHDVTVAGDKDTEAFSFKYYNYNSKINGFVYGPLKDKNALLKLAKVLENENFDIIHIHMIINVDWDLFEVLKNYKYVVSLHDYFFICPRIIMSAKEGEVCSKYDAEKCKRCISYLHRFKTFRYLSNKGSEVLGKNECFPYIPQKITTIRYHKFKELLENAVYLLPVSTRVREIYENSGIKAKYKVLHIGNISADKFNTEYTFREHEGKIKLVFLGRLSYYKGANLLLDIARRINLNKFEIHFFGYAGEYEKDLEENCIINHGKYKQSELDGILGQMDMGMVLPIWEDNGPQVVMEMLNNHLPVIGTRMGGIPDFVNESNGFLFNPFDSKDINKLYDFLDSIKISKIKEMKMNIRHTETTQAHQEKVLNIYQKVLTSI